MSSLNTKITFFKQVTAKPVVSVVFDVTNLFANDIKKVIGSITSLKEFVIRPDSLIGGYVMPEHSTTKGAREIAFNTFVQKAPAQLVQEVNARLHHHFGTDYIPNSVLFLQ